MSRNLRLSSELELAALLRWQRSNRSDMREAEAAHRVQQAGETATREPHKLEIPRSTRGPATPPIYPLIGLCRARLRAGIGRQLRGAGG